MEVGPGSYWEPLRAVGLLAPPSRHRVERIIPSDEGPFVYARNVVTGAGAVVRLDRWLRGFRPLDTTTG